MAKKKEILSEKQIDKTYEIVKGFDLTDAETGKETRYDVGKIPKFVREQDFEKDEWKALLAGGALKLVEPAESEAEKETIVFEKIGK